MVEFAFVGVLLVVLLFGIINMGVLLSFKQNLTQAASESARAGIAVENDDSDNTTDGTTSEPYSDERYEVVDDALNDTLGDHDKTCGTPGQDLGTAIPVAGVTCLRKIHDCGANTDDYAAITADRVTGDCLTVRIVYDNTGSNRLMPAFPLIAAMEPDTMSSQTTVRLVPVS
ncbi:MAG: TadE/TadG family type IV pilus assembly protein [Acidimicrobiia bacterium]